MKKSVVLLFLVCYNIAFSQIGKMHLKKSKFEIGKENTYVYEPPTGITIPSDAKVKIVYHNKSDYANLTASLIKKSNVYEFSCKVPDSTRTLILAVYGGKNTVDNNQGKAYDIFLRTSSEAELGKCMVNRIQTIGYANYYLGLKQDIKAESILLEYNNLYAKYPMMKEDISYGSYLSIKASINAEQAKPEVLDFAQKCEKKNSEEYLMLAFRLYSQLKMDDKVKQIVSNISAKYPNGEYEKNNFINEFRQHPDKTEEYILERLKLYTTRFKGSSEKSKDLFYSSLLRIYLTNKDIQKLDQYERLLTDKGMAASLYNSLAWSSSGEDLVTPPKDIEYAEKISKRSVDIIANLQKESSSPEEFQIAYNMVADTYALLLYKLNRFEEAFEYQDKINQSGVGMSNDAKERYAGMMGKVKSPEFTKKYIESELANGLDSRIMLAQLEEIYKKSNLSLTEFNKIKEKSIAAATAKNNAALVEKYGSTQAINFSLKNLEGKVINLADLKGKVVVLDFWATWCGPCRASFPAMQELVTKYKGKNVEFLFVNTWEKDKENSETVKKVGTFINDKKYTFNVVFDFDDTITAKYKVEGIPTKILIDKNGTILSDNASEQNLINLIDEQLSL